jgi:hypothetical protein
VIQTPDPEEFLPEENFLGDFERAYLDRPLNRRSPELKRTRSPSVRRSQPVNESSDFQQVVRSRTATRSPSPVGFKPSARGQPRIPAGRGAFQSPLQTRARGRSSLGEGRVHEERLPVLQDDIYPATSKVGHALSRFKDKFRKRCAPFRIFRQGDSDVFVRIDPKNPGQPPRQVVWGEERFKVVQALHEGEGHYGGVNKTRAKVADRYWFPRLTKFVNEFVKTCDVCQKERVGAAPRDDRTIFPTPPTTPWFRTHVDLCGPFEESGPQKYRYIAVAVDSVTKVVEVRPLRGTKAKGVDSEEVADFLQTEVVHKYPGVYEVVTDRGGEFGAKFTLLCKAWGIKHVKIAAKNPKANGRVERYMRVIKPALRKCAHEHPGEWHKHVSGVACDLRAAHQETIKMSPTMALFGREAILPIEREIPALSTSKQPNLDQEETDEPRERNVLKQWSICNPCVKLTLNRFSSFRK